MIFRGKDRRNAFGRKTNGILPFLFFLNDGDSVVFKIKIFDLFVVTSIVNLIKRKFYFVIETLFSLSLLVSVNVKF